MSFMDDGNIFNIPHENNRVFINAYLHENQVAPPTTTTAHDQPRPDDQPVTIKVKFTQQLVPHNHTRSRISQNDGVIIEFDYQHPSHPLRVFGSAEDARPVFEAMASSLQTHFGVRSEFGQLHWGGYYSNDVIQGIGGVVDRLSEAATCIVREALASAELLTIMVRVFKRTIVEAERYKLISLSILAHDDYEDDYDCNDDDDDDDEDEDEDEDDGREGFDEFVAEELVETVRYDGGDDLECSICLKEVPSGIHVARLACSHEFHKDCILLWLKKTQTCPLCRLKLVKRDLD